MSHILKENVEYPIVYRGNDYLVVRKGEKYELWQAPPFKKMRLNDLDPNGIQVGLAVVGAMK